jgi:hypothetical protein
MEEPLFSNERWMIRVVAGDPTYFYIDGPYDGIDDGILNHFFNWDAYGDIIYLFGDYAGLPQNLTNKIVIKQSSHKNDASFACYYHILDELTPTKSIENCCFDISFQGSLITHPIRKDILDSLKKFDRFHFEPTTFWAKCSLEEKAILRQKYLHVINDSQFVLCPRGVGLNSIRFFETMRMGRIPILIANDTKLPLNWLIKYENLIVRVPEHDIINTSDYVKQWLQTNDLEAVSQQIRQISLTYFSDLEVFTQLVIHEYKTMLNMRKITNY